MEFTYELKPTDLWNLQKHAKEFSSTIKRYNRNTYVLITISSFFLFSLTAYRMDLPIPLIIIYGLFHTFFWAASISPLFIGFMYFIKSNNVRRQLEREDFFGEYKLFMEEDGLTVKSPLKKKTYQWNDFIGKYETDSYYFLIYSGKEAVIIPKSSKELDDYLKTYIRFEPSTINSKRVKIQIILLIIYLLSFFISNFNEWTDPLHKIKADTAELFVSFEDKSNLQITSSVTQEQIDKLNDKLISVPATEDNLAEKFQIANWIREAEEQLYEDLPEDQITRTYHGEGEYWKIEDYRVKVSPILFRTYEGIMHMKDQDTYHADYLMTEFHVVFKWGKDMKIHREHRSSKIKGDNLNELDISSKSTGEFPNNREELDENGDPVTFEDIEEIYVIIQWKGENQDDLFEEKITLTSEDSKGN
ncbi:YcxB family protein [Gracilibacillus oryzae]|uniref:YcxB family protein n=1 Tax=Gracilibacillus oryzae TaxID=1672701 RepID=A0A7C8GQ73_9BACI|nr:YcxB family protein [Gracilibacillus oryzae]KAB8126000.1 YcxB family protein [Gracilibacillus oryzae]